MYQRDTAQLPSNVVSGMVTGPVTFYAAIHTSNTDSLTPPSGSLLVLPGNWGHFCLAIWGRSLHVTYLNQIYLHSNIISWPVAIDTLRSIVTVEWLDIRCDLTHSLVLYTFVYTWLDIRCDLPHFSIYWLFLSWLDIRCDLPHFRIFVCFPMILFRVTVSELVI